jgi:transglutaminase-like putative cysteine protease
MKRRAFLESCAALPASCLVSRMSGADGPMSAHAGWRTFTLTTRIEVADPSGATQLWIPVPAAANSDYQRRLSIDWQVAKQAEAALVRLPGYDVEVLHVRWSDARTVGPVTLTSRIATRDRMTSLSGMGHVPAESPQRLQRFLEPTRLLPVDGIVYTTAQRVAADHADTIDRARALYAWVVENTSRDPGTQGCGIGDVGSMLETGYLAGKCADINSLFVAMARSLGIPARDAYGVRVADSRRGYRSLGKSGDVTKAQHCRAEFYAAGHGWIPVDPADVRKVVLEEPPGNLGIDDPKVVAAREFLFGNWEMNWVAYNHGHDVALPGSEHKPVPFLMYPQGESGERRLDPLDPQAFRYSIRSAELNA